MSAFEPESDQPARLPDIEEESSTELGAGWLPTTFRALRHRNYRLFWSGQLVSLVGTWMQNAAQSWLVLTLANQEYGTANAALTVGLIAALGSLPIFIFTLFAGVLSDRNDRRRILLVTQTILMLLAFALGALTQSGGVRLWHVAVFSMLSGLTMAFDMPTRQAFIKDIASPHDLLNAIALNSSIFNLARIFGPAMAGRLIDIPSLGIPGALYLNGISFFAVIIGLLLIRISPKRRLAGGASVWAHLGEGFRYVANHPTIRILIIMMAVYSVFGFSYVVLMSVIAQQVLGQNAGGYGLLMSASGIGAFIGAIGLAARAGTIRKGSVLYGGGVLFSLALIVFSISRSFHLSLLILPVVGGGLVVSSAAINSLIQEIVPDHLRGRVISMWAFIFAGFTPLGALYAGMMAHYTSPSIAVLLGGVICLLLILWVTLRMRWLWRLP